MDIRRLLLTAALGLVLGSACVVAPASVPAAPSQAQQAVSGDAVATLAAAAARVTAEAVQTQAAADAQRTQAAEVTATREAWWFGMTQTLAANQALATDTSATATQAWRDRAVVEAAVQGTRAAGWTQGAVYLTQSAAQRLATQEWRRAERQQAVDNFLSWVARLFLAGLATIVLLLLLRLGWQWISSFHLRRLVLETRTGTLYLGYVNREPEALVLPKPAIVHTTPLAQIASQAQDAGQAAPPPPSDPEPDPLKRRALKLLWEAIEYEAKNKGWPQNRIPGHRELGWSSASEWTAAVASLGAEVLSKRGKGGGTRVSQKWESVLNLYYAVRDGRVRLMEPEGATA